MYDITVIPPEIWQDIFALACTDGGRTGLSLALSSKFLHAQSSRVRFHSVKLSSIASLEEFLAFTRTRPDGQKPLVRHLSLRLLPSQSRRLQPLLFYRRNNARDSVTNQREAERLLHSRLVNAANALFSMVAPTLRTLCLTTGYSHTLAPFPCDMPLLEELTIMGSISIIAGPNPCRLPALKRVHLLPQSAGSDTEELATALTASALCAAPLTHLRLSQIYDHQRPDLSSVLTRSLGLPGSSGILSDGDTAHMIRDKARASLSRVHEVVVQTIIPDLGWCGNAYFDYRRETLAFEGFVQHCNEVPDLHVLAVARKQRNFRWKERLHADWVDRMEGGRGCWIRDADEEEALEKRVERQGDVYNSIEDAVRNWDEDDFNGDGGDCDDIDEETLAFMMNEEGVCGGVIDDAEYPHSQATALHTFMKPSSSRGEDDGGRGGGDGRGRKCMIM